MSLLTFLPIFVADEPTNEKADREKSIDQEEAPLEAVEAVAEAKGTVLIILKIFLNF